MPSSRILYLLSLPFDKDAKFTLIATYPRFPPFCHISRCKVGATSAQRCTHDVVFSKRYYTPSKVEFKGGYTVFSMSVIPKFHPSVNISGFCSITSKASVRFCSHSHHTLTIRQCMFDRTEGSVLQELFFFVILAIRCLYYD